jgi:hypothetical protein
MVVLMAEKYHPKCTELPRLASPETGLDGYLAAFLEDRRFDFSGLD